MIMLSGCGKELNLPNQKENVAQSGNTIILTLHPDQAPITCDNFEKLVNEGFYNGLSFHRVVDDFMAQGGDPKGDGTGGSSETIKGEFKANGVNNELSHQRGIVSMARSMVALQASFLSVLMDSMQALLMGIMQHLLTLLKAWR